MLEPGVQEMKMWAFVATASVEEMHDLLTPCTQVRGEGRPVRPLRGKEEVAQLPPSFEEATIRQVYVLGEKVTWVRLHLHV